MPIQPTATARAARLERTIGKLTRAYRRRKSEVRRVDHLLIRVKSLSCAYCDAMEAARFCSDH